jgi:hypothetical protein
MVHTSGLIVDNEILVCTPFRDGGQRRHRIGPPKTALLQLAILDRMDSLYNRFS